MVAGHDVVRHFQMIHNGFCQLQFAVRSEFRHVAGMDDETDLGQGVHVGYAGFQVGRSAARADMRIRDVGEGQRIGR